ncbi:hypothetical protein Leryth_013213 [Lithospermum erythrorhizon]|nr:hypothetical protein Leryth_013213 [Lithospermum erythrorhizon]
MANTAFGNQRSKSTSDLDQLFRLRDLLRRSNSDGKDSFLFVTPKKNKEVKHEIISDKSKNNICNENSKGKRVTRGEKDEARSSYFSSPSRGTNRTLCGVLQAFFHASRNAYKNQR